MISKYLISLMLYGRDYLVYSTSKYPQIANNEYHEPENARYLLLHYTLALVIQSNTRRMRVSWCSRIQWVDEQRITRYVFYCTH